MKFFSSPSLVRLTVALSCLVLCGRAAEGEKGKALSGTSAGAATSPTKEVLPSAKEVLERYAKAIGGEENFLNYKSQHVLGTVQMGGQGINGKLEVFAARPNKLLMKMAIPGAGSTDTGFDGKVAWMNSPLTGAMLLEGKMAEEIATQADFDHVLHEPEHYTRMEVLGVEEFNGEECYKLQLVHRTGFQSVEFFSRKTGLQRGYIATQETPLGTVTTTTAVTDYKQFGEVLMPSRTVQKVAGMEIVMTMDEVKFNGVDMAVFELPKEVKALTEEPNPEVETPKSSGRETKSETREKKAEK